MKPWPIKTEWQVDGDPEDTVYTETFQDRSLGDIAQSLELLYGPLTYLRIELVSPEEDTDT